MAKRVALSAPVHDLQGNVTTIGDLLDEGRAYVVKVDHMISHRAESGERTAYRARLMDDESRSWEISPKAYESRAARGQAR